MCSEYTNKQQNIRSELINPNSCCHFPFVLLQIGEKTAESSVGAAVELPGHRSGIRAMAISNDDKMLVTCSSASVKVWNIATRSCIRTMPSGYGLCVAFVPGNRHVCGSHTSPLRALFN